MKIRIPARVMQYYDRTVYFIACCLFPPPKPIGVKIGDHQITLIDIALACYTIAIGVGLTLYFGHWIWFVATVLSMIMAAMIFEWLL